ncbi:MAG: agmatine deiminase family protein [Bacteroidales bacterium]|nr:agmatine deiminase family protein [Bacteroidales bacterium]
MSRYLPAEWEPQAFVQLTWPNTDTDWQPILERTIKCYCTIAYEIAQREPLVVVARDRHEVESVLDADTLRNTTIVEAPINDTWARDHGFITVRDGNRRIALDFQFNGWGLKFAADRDNRINRTLFDELLKNEGFAYENHLSWVLEGGSIESDGRGTLLTTSECLLSPNRNGAHSRDDIERYLRQCFGAERIMWLNHGYLNGDDTDSHIDTLARLAPNDTIIYVQCTDASDEHFHELSLMEQEIKQLRTADGRQYHLVGLPMCSPKYADGQRLPATYANFLYVNGALLVPTYNAPEDDAALAIFRATFPDREVVGIDCSPLIEQHGSLHCVTMQYPR